MAGRQLASILTRYERDRGSFAWALADAARHEGSAAPLAALGADVLLLPLLTDPAETVAHSAALALGRLSGHSASVAAGLVQAGVVGTLIKRMHQDGTKEPQPAAPTTGDAATDRRSAAKRAAVGMGMLVSLTRHSSQLAVAVADQGGLQAAVSCLADTDPEVKEGAAWVLAHVVSHSQELAERVCAAGALQVLVACLGPAPSAATSTSAGQSADAAVKRVAASALGDISGYSTELAAKVVEAGAVPAITALLRQTLSNDARLKRQLLCALMNVAKADASLAQAVVDAGAVPDVARCLKFADDTARRHAAACLREIVRHSPALATAVVQAPGEVLNALAAYAASNSSAQALPALTAFGFAADHSAELAEQVAAAPGALAALAAALQCGDKHSQAAAAWALGRIGGNAPAAATAATATLPRLCTLAADAPEGSDLQAKSLRAAAAIVGQVSDVAQLAPLVMQPGLAPALLELLLARCAAIMAKHPASRATFATAGALAHLEARQAELLPESNASQQIDACLRLFPEELRRHYSPAYAAKLLAALGSDPPPADAIPAVQPDTVATQHMEECASGEGGNNLTVPAAAAAAVPDEAGEQQAPPEAATVEASQQSEPLVGKTNVQAESQAAATTCEEAIEVQQGFGAAAEEQAEGQTTAADEAAEGPAPAATGEPEAANAEDQHAARPILEATLPEGGEQVTVEEQPPTKLDSEADPEHAAGQDDPAEPASAEAETAAT